MGLKEDIVDELHKNARVHYRRRHVLMLDIDNHWQADLADVSSIARYNRKHNFILTVIDTFSKFAFARKLKTKHGDEVTRAMQSIFDESNRVCEILESDRGKEFYNKHFQKLLREKNIRHYSTYSDMKASFKNESRFRSFSQTFSCVSSARLWKDSIAR